ncbi:alpha/beta hydrolase [Hymenobacter sp. HSC-4F20]|uniref:alpha/beta hydrolase n=1 Tax=Hymenobacter sp. HSC-4F20 TaxID=2864135 RepID=UPI001C72A446|nr:alpha/beta hydrolase [Hymenobacter sp. HSC-4F20]MBX0290842.1 alpha/beta hydrolase [Hymenobacter sp. HSC-4F20]
MSSVSAAATPAIYQPDPLGVDFDQLVLPQPPDYEGAVHAVLVRHRRKLPAPAHRAALYIHGFNDYFFQREMAAEYARHGYQFFALELRKYGRALLPHQRPNNVRDIAEYFLDLDAAFKQVQAEGWTDVVLSGHSTGGLIAALYAAHRRPPELVALVLNSPFLELHQSWLRRHVAVPAAVALGARWPNLPLPAGLPDTYGQSLHRAYRGHWEYNLAWKPNHVFPVNAGWLRAIRRGQARVRRGLQITQPVLVLHSDRTTGGSAWHPDVQCTDIVLDVDHIRALAPRLGQRVTVRAVPGAVHDVFLSAPLVRTDAYQRVFAWLAGVVPAPPAAPSHIPR